MAYQLAMAMRAEGYNRRSPSAIGHVVHLYHMQYAVEIATVFRISSRHLHLDPHPGGPSLASELASQAGTKLGETPGPTGGRKKLQTRFDN